MNKRINERKNKWIKERMKEWMKEWMNKRIKEWMEEWKNEWKNKRRGQKIDAWIRHRYLCLFFFVCVLSEAGNTTKFAKFLTIVTFRRCQVMLIFRRICLRDWRPSWNRALRRPGFRRPIARSELLPAKVGGGKRVDIVIQFCYVVTLLISWLIN